MSSCAVCSDASRLGPIPLHPQPIANPRMPSPPTATRSAPGASRPAPPPAQPPARQNPRDAPTADHRLASTAPARAGNAADAGCESAASSSADRSARNARSDKRRSNARANASPSTCSDTGFTLAGRAGQGRIPSGCGAGPTEVRTPPSGFARRAPAAYANVIRTHGHGAPPTQAVLRCRRGEPFVLLHPAYPRPQLASTRDRRGSARPLRPAALAHGGGAGRGARAERKSAALLLDPHRA